MTSDLRSRARHRVLPAFALILACLASPAAALDFVTQRRSHSTTLMPNGNVLAVGGLTTNSDASTTNSVEIDIATNSNITPMTAAVYPLAIASHTATLLPDGRVLVAGGWTGAAATNESCLFDYRSGAWTSLAGCPNMITARMNHTATLLNDGRVLVAGGETAPGAATNACELFNPDTSLWTACGSSLGLGRAHHTASLLHDGRVLVAGGVETTAPGPFPDFAVSTELFDPAANGGAGRFNPGPALIAKRAYHTATQIGNFKIVIAGGYNGKNVQQSLGYLESVEVYDPISDSVSPAEPMQARKMNHTALLNPDGHLHTFSGLGNITTTFLQAPAVSIANGTLLIQNSAANTSILGSVSPNTAITVGVLNSILTDPELAVPVSGRIVDGEVQFSSRVIAADPLFLQMPNGVISSLDGVDVDAGVIPGYQATLLGVGGTASFAFQDVGSLSAAIAEAGSQVNTVSNAAGSDCSSTTQIPAQKICSVTDFRLVIDIDVPMPFATIGSTIVNGEARIISAALSLASDETTKGWDLALTSGTASITGCGPVVFDAVRGPFLNCQGRDFRMTTATGLSAGTIKNSTVVPVNLPGETSIVNIELSGMQLRLQYVPYSFNLAGETLAVDVATFVVRHMIFADDERFHDDNTWDFGVPSLTRTDHSSLLMPDGDMMIYGGRLCTSAANCAAFNYTPQDAFTGYVTVPADPATAWTAGAVMVNARSNHSATLLHDGRILVAGGTQGPTVIRKSEIFDGTTWAETGPLNDAHSNHSAVLLTNDQVLVAGGFTTLGSTGATNASETFFFDTLTWSRADPMISSRSFHSTTLLPDGHALVAGGFALGAYLSSAEVFISTTRAWRSVGAMTQAGGRAQHTATLLQDGRVLVAGGVNVGGVLSSAEFYDFRTGAWTASAGALNTSRHSHSATLLADGRVLVAGGNDGFGEISKAEIYDPVTDAWSELDPANLGPGKDMLVPRLNHAAQLLPNGKVLVTGGFTALGNSINIAEGFDVHLGTWQFQGLMRTPRGNHASLLRPDGRVMLIGGLNGINAVATTETQYFGVGSPDSEFVSESLRQPASIVLDTSTVLPAQDLTIRGAQFRGVTEAAGGGAGSRDSDHTHPRLVLQRYDSDGNGAGSSDAYSVDLTTRIMNPDLSAGYATLAQKWSRFDSSITVRLPGQTNLPFGWYHLRIGANGQFSDSAPLQVGPPRPPGGPGVPVGTLIGVSSVSWTWGAASGALDGYNVYSATNGVFIATIPKSGGATETFIQRGLGPDTSTLIKVAAFSLSGDGGVAVATIPINTLSGVITDLQGQALSVSTIQWSWAVNPVANFYKVYSASAATLIASTPTATFIQSGLSTNTAFGIMVQAITAAGAGALTAPTTVFTLAAVPIPNVPALASVSTGGFVARWTFNTNPDITTYRVEHSNNADTSTTVVSGITDSQLGIPGTPNLLFNVVVAAANGDGVLSAFASLGSTATLAKAPANFIVTAFDPSSLLVQWDPNGNPDYTVYQVLASTDIFVSQISTPIPFALGYTSAAANLSGLFTNTVYDLRVMARNLTGTETAFISTRGFTAGGGPVGSLSFVAQKNQLSTLSGNLITGRRIEVLVFPGTFDEDVRLTISSVPVAGAAVNCGPNPSVVRVTADPPRQPKIPIEFAIGYTVPEFGNDPSDLTVVRHDPTFNSCVPLITTVDKGNLVARTRLNHLSDFQLISRSGFGDLGVARAFPNPLYTSRGDGFFTFDQMPHSTRVRVYTLHGYLVFDAVADSRGMTTWNAANLHGRPVASGLYLAVFERGNERKILKLAVVR